MSESIWEVDIDEVRLQGVEPWEVDRVVQALEGELTRVLEDLPVSIDPPPVSGRELPPVISHPAVHPEEAGRMLAGRVADYIRSSLPSPPRRPS